MSSPKTIDRGPDKSFAYFHLFCAITIIAIKRTAIKNREKVTALGSIWLAILAPATKDTETNIEKHNIAI
tara:strand:+ start:147 stop:356 length:210 start_codon:yes stop_codon:yes gene_type:complete